MSGASAGHAMTRKMHRAAPRRTGRVIPGRMLLAPAPASALASRRCSVAAAPHPAVPKPSARRGRMSAIATIAVLAVLAGPITPDFSVAVQPAQLTLIQGRTATAAVAVTRNDGFSRDIHLSVAGAPAGMTAAIGDDNTLTLSLGRDVHVGDHVLTVRGTAGDTMRTATLRVRVLQSRPAAAAFAHSLAVDTAGGLWTFGQNDKGQLGNGGAEHQAVPVRIGADTNWVAVAGGRAHSVALRSDGSLWVTGDNQQGQLGIGGPQHTGWQRVGSDSDWVAVAAGDYHTMAIRADRSLWIWGQNRYGQVGNGTNARAMAPVRVAGENWVVVGGGADHTAAVRADGSLWAWGYNGYGQLGTGNTTESRTPVRVGAASDWRTVSAGGSATTALKTDGSAWSWGSNVSGQLGLGGGGNRNAPVRIGQDADWTDIAAGTGTTFLRKRDGSLWAAGANSNGVLGVDGAQNRNQPVRSGGAGWHFVSAGGTHALALGEGGALSSWGSNDHGQLGHGSTAARGNGAVQAVRVRWP